MTLDDGARQTEAIAFINANVFKTPAWLLPAEVLRKIEPTSGQARVLALQQAALNGVLGSARLLRLQEHEAILGDQAYTTAQLLTDLHAGILGELSEASPKIDPYRRNLQRAFVDILIARLAPAPAAAGAAGIAAAPALRDDSRGAIRAELRAIRSLLVQEGKGADTATKNHLTDLREQIAQALEPKK